MTVEAHVMNYRQGSERFAKKAAIATLRCEKRAVIAVHLGKFADGLFVLACDLSTLESSRQEAQKELRSQGFTSGTSRTFASEDVAELAHHLGQLIFFNMGKDNIRFLLPYLPEDSSYLKGVKDPKLKTFGPLRSAPLPIRSEPELLASPKVWIDDPSTAPVKTKYVDGKLVIVPPPEPETFYDDNPLYRAF